MFAIGNFGSLRARGAALAGGVLAVLYSVPTTAQDSKAIGETVKVETEASGTLSGVKRTLVSGSDVFVDDLVRTGPKSLAQLTFLDDTKLALGPAAQVRLDKFVFDPDKGAQSVTLNIAKGAFRFVTGDSDPRAFKIVTPAATIGVRGTIVEVRIGKPRTIVVLVEGKANVCSIKRKGSCAALLEADDYVSINAAGVIDGPHTGGSKVFAFRSFCTGGSGVCSITKAEAAPSETAPAAAPPPSFAAVGGSNASAKPESSNQSNAQSGTQTSPSTTPSNPTTSPSNTPSTPSRTGIGAGRK